MEKHAADRTVKPADTAERISKYDNNPKARPRCAF